MAYTNIDDPSAYFQTKIYTGDGNNNRAITNDGNSDLQPDFIWLKDRNVGFGHRLTDSTRGITKNLASETSGAESTSTTQYASWNTDGFTLIYGGQQVPNFNGHTYVAWQWKANGGTTASNSDGSITSTVQANQDAGFSIVTYTGTGSAGTIGHGLGVVPSVMMIKNREYAASWVVYHKDIHADAEEYGLRLNNTNARESNSGFWNNTAPTSSVFTIGGNAGVNNGDNTDTLVAYCFAEKQGYSKFGSYEGNGNANGPFVYTGFKPAFVIIKNIDNGGYDWAIMDSKRTPTNANGTYEFLWANLSGAEFTDGDSGINMEIDFLSNGFKIRTARPELNLASTFIYMAFAENPFTTSTGIPTTAR